MKPHAFNRVFALLVYVSMLTLWAPLFAYETYADWRLRHFSAAQLANPISADNFDANADGVPNLLHFAYGLSPWEAPPPDLVAPGISADGRNLTFRFPQRLAPGDIRYQPEFSRDLFVWHTGLDFFSTAARDPLDADLSWLTVRALAPLDLDGRQFFRLRITRLIDSDFDGLDDAWELAHFGYLSQGYYDDFDGDGVINGEAQTLGADPRSGQLARDVIEPSWGEDSYLYISEETASGFTLQWSEATDDRSGELRYILYRNNQAQGPATSARTLTVNTTELSGDQSWHVRPVDSAGNVGAPSTAVKRTLVPLTDLPVYHISRQVSQSQGPWGWTEFTIYPNRPTKWYATKTDQYIISVHSQGYVNNAEKRGGRQRLDMTRTDVWNAHPVDAATVSVDGVVTHYSEQFDHGASTYTENINGQWLGLSNFRGTRTQWWAGSDDPFREPETQIDVATSYTSPNSFFYGYLGVDVTISSTEHHYRVDRDSAVPEEDTYSRWHAKLATVLSNEVTASMVLATLKQRMPVIANQAWGSSGASSSFSKTGPLSFSISEAEYRVKLATTEAGKRYRMRWLEVFYPKQIPGQPATPPSAQQFHELVFAGDGQPYESAVYPLPSPQEEGTVELVSINVAMDTALALSVNDNFDERLFESATTWETDASTPSPLRTDGRPSLADLAPLWLSDGWSSDGFANDYVRGFGEGTRSVRLSVVGGAERIRLHAMARTGSGPGGSYTSADWHEISSGEELNGLVFDRKDSSGNLLPSWLIYTEGLAPGKVVLQIEVDRFGTVLTEQKTLYVTRTELAVRDPETNETHVAGGLLEGSEPRPTVDLRVDSAAVTAAGDELVVTVSGTVQDPMSEILIDALLRTRSLTFEVNGRTVDGLVNLSALSSGGALLRPWQSANFDVSFTRTLRIPVHGPGVKVLRAVTSPNQAGLRGWDEAMVLVGRIPEGDGREPEAKPLRVVSVHLADGTPGGSAAPAVLRVEGLAEAPDDFPLEISDNRGEQLAAGLTFSPRYFYVVGPAATGQPVRYLVTLDDSIKLPPRETLRAIQAGQGNFVLRAGNQIVSEATVQVVPAKTPVLPKVTLPRAARSLDEIEHFYKLIYGRRAAGDTGDKPLGRELRDVFNQINGLLQLVEGDEVEGGPDVNGRLVISVGEELDPISAAQGVFETLVKLSNTPAMQSHLDVLTVFGPLRLSKVRGEAAELGSAVAEIYKAGLSIFNEGADWAVAIDEISDGNYKAAIGFLPLMPTGVSLIVKNKTANTILAKFSGDARTVIAGAMRAMKLDKIRGRLEVVHAIRSLRDAGFIGKAEIDMMVESGALTITDGSSRRQLRRLLGSPPSFFGYEAHHWIPVEKEIQKNALRRCIDPNEHGQWLVKTVHQTIHNVPAPGFKFKGKEFTSNVHNGFWDAFFVNFPIATEQQILDFAYYLQHTVYKL